MFDIKKYRESSILDRFKRLTCKSSTKYIKYREKPDVIVNMDFLSRRNDEQGDELKCRSKLIHFSFNRTVINVFFFFVALKTTLMHCELALDSFYILLVLERISHFLLLSLRLE